MRSLVSLLDGAVQRAASEVTLESGQPVVYLTARGTEAETEILPRGELFDMIVHAVDEGQQVELAVGNPVEFEVAAAAKWSVYAEPGMEGITVRARRDLGAPELHIELDYISEAGPAGGFDDLGTGAIPETGGGDFGLDLPDSGPLALEGPDFHGGTPGRKDATLGAVPENEISADFGSSTGASPGAAYESGTWTLDDDDEFDLGGGPAPDEDSLPLGFMDSPRGEHIGVPDDDDEEEFNPFASPVIGAEDSERRRTLSPTVRAMEASPAASNAVEAHAGTQHLLAASPRPGLSGASPSLRSTKREMNPYTSEGDTHRDVPVKADGGDLSGLVTEIGEGTLVYIREPGLAERLASGFRARAVSLDDLADLDEVSRDVRNAPPGTIVIVRCEDPSAALGWILRRLEQGLRVFVETRARSVDGARRILLGVSASERAEQWLDNHSCLAVEAGAAGPHLVPG